MLGGEVTGETLALSAKAIASELTPEQFEFACVQAVKRCKFFPRPAELIALGQGDDGRPDIEAAWAMCPSTEERSVVWTEEIAEAFGLCRPLLTDGDHIAARMVFKEQYQKLLTRARIDHKPVRWIPSLGWDKSDRVRALSEAIQKHRIEAKHAYGLLAPEQQDELLLQLPAPTRLLLVGKGALNLKYLTGLQSTIHTLAEAHEMEPLKITMPVVAEESVFDNPVRLKERREYLKKQADTLARHNPESLRKAKSAKRTRKIPK